MPSCSGTGAAALAASLLLVWPANAQRAAHVTPGAWWASSPDSGRTAPTWLAPVSSMLVPGTGQLIQQQDRGAVYLILEAFLLQRFVALRHEGRGHADRYRDLALRVARSPFSPVLRDTTFEYFEKMSAFLESGPYDTDPGPRFVPPGRPPDV